MKYKIEISSGGLTIARAYPPHGVATPEAVHELPNEPNGQGSTITRDDDFDFSAATSP